MNTEINNVTIVSLGALSSIRNILLQEGTAMAGHLLFGLIKLLMISTPFLSMVMMLLALWGVVGKTTYTDLDTTKKVIALDAKEAKNYPVNETKKIEQCPEELKSPDIAPEIENPIHNKIDWGKAV
jgi:hypothetical protein